MFCLVPSSQNSRRKIMVTWTPCFLTGHPQEEGLASEQGDWVWHRSKGFMKGPEELLPHCRFDISILGAVWGWDGSAVMLCMKKILFWLLQGLSMLHPQTNHNEIIEVPGTDHENVSALTCPALCFCVLKGKQTLSRWNSWCYYLSCTNFFFYWKNRDPVWVGMGPD